MPRLKEERILDVRLVFCDQSPEVVAAWRRQLEGRENYDGVEIREGLVLDGGTDACVCPGNSFGFMDSGLALHLSEALGWHLQEELREIVRTRFDGEILVGQAIVHPTGQQPRWLVYAPAVRVPASSEGTLDAYLAMRGGLLAIRDHNLSSPDPDSRIASLAVSGLCTGKAGMNAHIAVRQMRYAFELVTGQRGFGDKNVSQLTRRDAKLRAIPGSVAAEGKA